MSLGLIWLAIILLLPIIGLYLLRVNAVPVFLALCLGYVAMTFGSGNANLLATQGSRLMAPNNIVNLFFLLIPAIVTTIFAIGTSKGKKRLINLVPSVGLGLVGALLVVPVLPKTIEGAIQATKYWGYVEGYEATIVMFSSVIILIFFWFTFRKTKRGSEHAK